MRSLSGRAHPRGVVGFHEQILKTSAVTGRMHQAIFAGRPKRNGPPDGRPAEFGRLSKEWSYDYGPTFVKKAS
jgi:hypothetical protein